MDHKRDIGLPPLARVMGVGRQQQSEMCVCDFVAVVLGEWVGGLARVWKGGVLLCLCVL